MISALFRRSLTSVGGGALGAILAAVPFTPNLSPIVAFGQDQVIQTRTVAAAGRPASSKERTDHGSIANKIGVMSAAHAAPTTGAMESPHSRVGLIAAYVDAVERFAELAITAKTFEQTIASLKAELETDQLVGAERAEVQASLGAAEGKLDQIRADMETAAKTQSRALAAASSKDVTDGVIATVNAILKVDPQGVDPSGDRVITNP